MFKYRRPLIALTLLAALGAGSVTTSGPPGAHAAGCPAGTICDQALGVALTIPARWRQLAPGKLPPHVLGFAIPVAGSVDADERLTIASWGATADRNDGHAAARGAVRLIGGESVPVTRRAVRYGGAPGVLVEGLAGPGPVTAVVLAHRGAEYLILAPGKSLAPDQRQALSSLRFVARVGPFPAANPVAPATSPVSRPIPLKLAVAPNPVRLGQTIAVSVIGLKPGEMLSFQAAPLSVKGFGGGNMGTRRANTAGVIRFQYPAFRYRWEVGRWAIRAYASHGPRVASTTLTVKGK